MKKIFLIVGLILLVGAASAQKTTKDTNSVLKKNEFLLDFISPTLSHGRQQDNFGIMYRRNYNKVSLRLNISGSYGGNYSYAVDSNNTQNYKQYFFRSAIGIQKNVPISKNCQFYWGGDIFLLYE